MRCSSCGESWFVPAPEPIDAEPIAEKPAKRRKAAPRAAARDADDADETPRFKVGFADIEDGDDAPEPAPRARRGRAASKSAAAEEDEAPSRPARKTAAVKKAAAKARPAPDDDETDFDGDEDELFEPRPTRGRAASKLKAPAPAEDDAEEDAPKGWRKGRKFLVEDADADEAAERPFFARREKPSPLRAARDRDAGPGADARANTGADNGRGDGERLRFVDDEEAAPRRGYNAFDDFQPTPGDYVVDADWEDIEEDGERGRGFGRRIRAERRRATALARMEDVRAFDPETLDEEFFASLRVTPRELERAIRKARRRAEARDKNRLTPLRVVGWAAWAVVIAGAGYGLVTYRDDIVKMAPKAADAYAVIGIEANPYGLSIENVHHRLAMSSGGPMIEITGNLRNETPQAVKAPLLQAEALGPRGELLARWTFTASESDVATGGSVDFSTRAEAPDGVAEVALSFAPDGVARRAD